MNGQDKCPKCGATDITTHLSSGKLQCCYCRWMFESDTKGMRTDTVKEKRVSSHFNNITEDDGLITLKCTSCGAEVVVNTADKLQNRCHWCRNILSVNDAVPNGAVPDYILPFKVPRERAQELMDSFVKKRKLFVNRRFKHEFTLDNIIGVYFPYAIIDSDTHATFSGEGQVITHRYKNDDSVTAYDLDVFKVERDFDIGVRGLTLETATDAYDRSESSTRNIITSLMPFDTANCVPFKANYLNGFNSEKRDMNFDKVQPIIREQLDAIVINEALKSTDNKYTNGIRWDRESYDIDCTDTSTAYLPIWVYSYLQKSSSKNILHYIAVNARTEETMGSVPYSFLKLFVGAVLFQIFTILYLLFAPAGQEMLDALGVYSPLLFILPGFLFYFGVKELYRNRKAKHDYLNETMINISNMKTSDKLVNKLKHVKPDRIKGENSTPKLHKAKFKSK